MSRELSFFELQDDSPVTPAAHALAGERSIPHTLNFDEIEMDIYATKTNLW